MGENGNEMNKKVGTWYWNAGMRIP